MKTPSQNIRFVEKSNENPTTESSDLVALKDYFYTKFNSLEVKITNDTECKGFWDFRIFLNMAMQQSEPFWPGKLTSAMYQSRCERTTNNELSGYVSRQL